MSSGIKKGVGVVVILALIGFVAWVICRLIRLNNKVSELEVSKQPKPDVVIQEIETNRVDISLECIDDLLNLFKDYDDIIQDLLTAKRRLIDGEDADATRIVAKILENLAYSIAEREDYEWFYALKNASKLDFNQLIKRFRNKEIFDQEEYQFAMKLRKFRNDVLHKLNPEGKNCPNDKRLNLHAGIMLIKKLATRSIIKILPSGQEESNKQIVIQINE